MSKKVKMESVNGYILIHQNGFNHITIQTNSEFFNQEIHVKVEHDRMIFRIPKLDDLKTYKPRRQRKNVKWFQFSLAAEKESGKFFFDEESNIDQVIVYCK